MWFAINPNSPVPIYVQIAENIKTLIRSGKILPGQFLPSVRNLARDLGVNVNTVVKAYKVLESEGYISLARGEGFVVNNFNPGEKWQEIDKLFEEATKKAKIYGIALEKILELVKKHYER